MAPRSQSSTILIVLILLITFPVWMAAGAVIFGILAGVFGAVIGIFAALVGVCVALIALPFKILFGIGSWGWNDWGWHGIFPVHYKGFFFIVLIVIALLIVQGRKKLN